MNHLAVEAQRTPPPAPEVWMGNQPHCPDNQRENP